MEENNFLFALTMTALAGLSTGIGGIFAFFTRRTNTKILSVILGFSAGVMIYISMAEMLHDAREYLIQAMGIEKGSWVTVISFFAGILLIASIDRLIPYRDNPHELHMIEEMDKQPQCTLNFKLLRTALITALGIALHNFPEGLAAFTSAMKRPSLGIAIAVAIAIHNIPEGIAVSVPVYCATGNRKKAFGYSLLSGLSEPFGAIIGYIILFRILNDVVYGVLFAAVAGIMVFISLDELLPTAREYGEHHLSIYGLVAGMAIIAVSLLLFI